MATPVAVPAKPGAPHTPLASLIKRGKLKQPLRVVLYGPEGIGKTTFAADAPNPIFLGAEDGTANFDVARYEPTSWSDALAFLRQLATDAHDFGTIVVDTANWLEPRIWEHVCRRDNSLKEFKGKLLTVDGRSNIEGYGFGKGFNVACEEWRLLVAALGNLHRKGLHAIVLDHSVVRKYKNPTAEDYGRIVPKIDDRAAGILKEWCDAVLYADFETFVTKFDGERRLKAVGGRTRVVHTEHTAAFDAKNRYCLPATLPLSWGEFVRAAYPDSTEAAARAERLRREIRARVAESGDAAKAAEVETWLAKVGDDVPRLATNLNNMMAKLAERAAETPAQDEEQEEQ